MCITIRVCEYTVQAEDIGPNAHEIHAQSKFISIYELAYCSPIVVPFIVSFDGCLTSCFARHSIDALQFKLNYIVLYAYAVKNKG